MFVCGGLHTNGINRCYVFCRTVLKILLEFPDVLPRALLHFFHGNTIFVLNFSPSWWTLEQIFRQKSTLFLLLHISTSINVYQTTTFMFMVYYTLSLIDMAETWLNIAFFEEQLAFFSALCMCMNKEKDTKMEACICRTLARLSYRNAWSMAEWNTSLTVCKSVILNS